MHQIITINMYFCLFLNTPMDALRVSLGSTVPGLGGCEQFPGPCLPERQSLLSHCGKCGASQLSINTGRRLCPQPAPPSVARVLALAGVLPGAVTRSAFA